jgi:hypothetical protein
VVLLGLRKITYLEGIITSNLEFKLFFFISAAKNFFFFFSKIDKKI